MFEWLQSGSQFQKFELYQGIVPNCRVQSFKKHILLLYNDLKTFVDVEGTKEVKRMINLLAITVNLYHEIDADPSGSGSKTDRVRKQMLIRYT